MRSKRPGRVAGSAVIVAMIAVALLCGGDGANAPRDASAVSSRSAHDPNAARPSPESDRSAASARSAQEPDAASSRSAREPNVTSSRSASDSGVASAHDARSRAAVATTSSSFSRSDEPDAPRTNALERAPDGVLAGVVVDGLGVARDVRLVLAPIDGSPAERLAAQRRLSDLALDHGRFRFEGVPPGRYELTTCDELYCAPPLVIESDGRGLAGIVLDVRVGQRVQVELGARGVVHVHDEHGRVWHEREHDGTALLALLPGTYRVEARTQDGAEHGLDVVVREKPVRIDFRP